jgi:hypothetical protein
MLLFYVKVVIFYALHGVTVKKGSHYKGGMWPLIGLTLVLTLGLLIAHGMTKRQEIINNWSKYRMDPRYLFTAFMYKPEDDPRSRLQFTSDNFNDVLAHVLSDTFKIFLDPVFKIFHLFTGSIHQSLGGILGMRTVLGTMWRDFMIMIRGFMNRYAATFHELRKTYMRLHVSVQRVWAMTMASVWTGISTIHSVMSFFDLMINICIVILAALVVMVVFLWFVLFPFVPLILVIISICVAAGFGVGGMAAAFCFGEDALVVKADGQAVPISQIGLGDILHGGATVTAVMEFESDVGSANDFYTVDGIPVSGSHLLYEGKTAVPVEKSKAARKSPLAEGKRIFCINTTDHRIPVQSPNTGNIHIFADWEELDDELSAQSEWNRQVFQTLNPGATWTMPTEAVLRSESAVCTNTRVRTPSGAVEAGSIRPGDIVMNADGLPVRVQGTVGIAREQVGSAVRLDQNSYISTGAWIRLSSDGTWTQCQSGERAREGRWCSLFTDDGTFLLDNGIAVRDFSDIGASRISSMSGFVLDYLNGK